MSRALLRVVALGVGLALGAMSTDATAERTTLLDSPYDDAEAGRVGAEGVARQVGILDDPELTGYVQRIGDKLLRAVPRRAFRYVFQVVDQAEPNAFALPGGYVFVSRGLLALASSEDELACVIGHEIAHVAKRHAAARQGASRGPFPLVSPLLRAGRQAAYSRDLERTADHDGQILCSAAGYDPRGLATFLESLMRYEKLEAGGTRQAGYFDSHPLSRERASIAFIQSSELRWKRDASIGDPRAALLEQTEGLPLGQRPESGVFIGSVFVHPDLGFKLRFPRQWRTTNEGPVVGAESPVGDAVVYLTADAEEGPPERVARTWAEKSLPAQVRVQDSGPFRVGRVQAWQLDLLATSPRGPSVRSYVTFIPHLGGRVWRITGTGLAGPNLKSTLITARSFRELNQEDRAAVQTRRLRVVAAQAGEGLASLVERTGSAWDVQETSVMNGGLDTGAVFAGGESVKIARAEVYTPAAQEE